MSKKFIILVNLFVVTGVYRSRLNFVTSEKLNYHLSVELKYLPDRDEWEISIRDGTWVVAAD